MTETVWEVKSAPRDVVKELAYELEIPKPVAAIYASRGLNTADAVREWNEIGFHKLHNPYDLNDIEPFLARMNRAIDAKEKIYVFGDYDVDGVTSTAVVVTVLRMLGANFEYRVPHRQYDGYDIKRKIVDEAAAKGATLLMTVDCGIVAFDAVKYANDKGIDVVITDHHMPSSDGKLPDAVAVINPNRLDSTYPFRGLAGVGISFKVMTALAVSRGMKAKKVADAVLEFAALGTVADVAPMWDENRTIVRLGCEHLASTTKPGVAALLKVAGIKPGGKVDTTSIGFFIGPRINAIGRLADAATALDLLLETSEPRAKFLANTLENANARRQDLQARTVDEAMTFVKDLNEATRFVVVSAKGWEKGLVGLVAGKLAEHTACPALCLTVLPNGFAVGSGRSTRTFDLLSCLKSDAVKDIWAWRDGVWQVGLSPDGTEMVAAEMEGNETVSSKSGVSGEDWALAFLANRHNCSPICGGHEFAAGFTVPAFSIDALRAACDTYAIASQSGEPIRRVLEIDAEMRSDHLNMRTLRAVEEMSPFGAKNPEPILIARGMVITESKTINNKHLKLRLKGPDEGDGHVNAMAWRRADEAALYPEGSRVDICFKLTEDNFMGRTGLSLTIEDIRIARDM